MGRDETVLLEDDLSMGRMDVGSSKDKCVKNNQPEEDVGPSSYVSIVVDGQDEHDTIYSIEWAKCSKKGSTVVSRWDEKAGLRRVAVRSQVIDVLIGTRDKGDRQ